MNFKKNAILISLVLIISAIAVAGCLDSDENEDGIDVVAVSILPQKEMVQSIVGDDITVLVMIPAGQSPHDYSPTPSQLIDLVDADIYYKIGTGLEFEEIHMDTLKETNPDMKIVDLSVGVSLKSFDEHHGADHHDHDHDHDHEEELENEEDDEHDHDHDGTDPHIWLSPNNMKTMAFNVLNGLKNVDPDNSEDYQSNHDAYVSTLDLLIEEMEEELGPYQDRAFLVYHEAWGYFGDDFDLIQLSVEQDGKQPGPQGIAAIIEQAKEHNITVVFVSPQYDSSSASQIAEEIDGEVLQVDPLAQNYMDNLRSVSDKMVQGFS
jgi:zinc transport system substrate-binding protein